MLEVKELEELKKVKQWVGYKKERHGERVTKLPKDPMTGYNAKTNDPKTWGTFAEAVEAVERFNFDGVGFMLYGGYFGVDIDHCIENGTIDPKANDIIKTLNSYTELSPSGTGLHVICKGELKSGSKKSEQLEIYQITKDLKGGRYFTMTGNVYGQPKPIAERTAEIETIISKHFENKKAASSKPVETVKALDDYEVIIKMFNSKNGSEIKALMSGDTMGMGHSEAALALCNHLAYWTNGNPAQMDSIFRGSRLYDTMKIESGVNKWDKVHYSSGETYGEATINKALENFTPYQRTQRTTRQQTAGTQEESQPEPIEVKTMSEAANDFFSWIDEDISQKVKPCFIQSIDEMNGGGLPVGISMLMGESSLGKTALALNMAENMAARGEKVLFISTEMPRNVCIARGISRITKNITYADIITGKVSKEKYLESAKQYFNTCGKNLIFIECYGGTTPSFIEKVINEQEVKTVFIDYLQQLNTSDGRQYEERIKMKNVATELLKICNDKDIAMILLSSVGRENYGKRLGMESGKECGELEYNAALVMGIQYTSALYKDLDRQEREQEKARKGGRLVSVTILKNRLTSGTGEANFNFKAGLNTFEPLAKIPTAEELGIELEEFKNKKKNKTKKQNEANTLYSNSK